MKRIHLLAGDEILILFAQGDGPLLIAFGLLKEGLGPFNIGLAGFEHGFVLINVRLIQQGVDEGQQISPLHDLVEVGMKFRDRSGDDRANRHL